MSGRRLLTTVSVLVCLVACGGEPGEERSERSGGETRSYEARGVVRGVTDGDGATRREILIAHEEIPGFVSSTGETVGMQAMTMPFPVAEGVEVGDLEIGDRIRFRFVVDWDASPYYQVVEIEELAAPGTGMR